MIGDAAAKLRDIRVSDLLQGVGLPRPGPSVELGVTGLSRAGKTIFIASLVNNLLNAEAAHEKGLLRGLDVLDEGRLMGARLRSVADPTVPEFPLGRVINALTGAAPSWPEPTEGISRIGLEIRYRRSSRWRNKVLPEQAALTLDIVDYPGEWLVDLPMLRQSYEEWSQAMVARAERPERAPLARAWRDRLAARAPDAPHDDAFAVEVSQLYAEYLATAAGPPHNLRFNQPGRFLRPGELRHAPVLRFCPLPGLEPGARPKPGSLHDAFARTYRLYLDKVVRPFYEKHFRRLNRQVVLVDVLKAVNDGPAAFEDMADALAATMENFRHGPNGLLSWLTGKRIEKVLFAATKADHISRSDRGDLANLLRRMVNRIDRRHEVRWSGAEVEVLPIAAIRATEDRIRADTGRYVLLGRRDGDAQEVALEPGAIPVDYPPPWGEFHYRFWDFRLPHRPGFGLSGFPNLNMAAAMQILFGDRFE